MKTPLLPIGKYSSAQLTSQFSTEKDKWCNQRIDRRPAIVMAAAFLECNLNGQYVPISRK